MKDKKKWIYSILCLFIFVVGVSFAYFVAQNGNGAVGNIDVISNSLDDLNFSAGDPISLKITQFNFTQGGGNLSDSTTATASLKANNSTNKASYTYNVYFAVYGNTYKYVTISKNPEVILTIVDPNGNEVTEIDGLTYYDGTTTKGAKGFDITDFDGLKTIANNYTITSSSSTVYTTQEWQFKMTFVNYDFNQGEAYGGDASGIYANIIIQKGPLLTSIADVCTNDDNLANCITTLSQKSVSRATNIYYHDSNLENGANDNSYRYAGASEQVNNFICFGSTTSPCPTDNLYRIIGVIDDKVKLIKYDYMTTDELGTNGDYSKTYKERGLDSTYKGTYGDGERIGVYHWNYKADTEINDGHGSNTWSTSLLNKTNLNTNFINYLGTEWANKIAMTTWKVGGNTWPNIGRAIPSVAYQNEITNPDATNTTDNATTYDAKIGLMYVSDYGFAASPSAWVSKMDNYGQEDITSNNWMYMGLWEWTISRDSDYSYNAFFVNLGGNLSNGYARGDLAGRASFNLDPSITYKSGMGSMSDPIIIN